MEKRQHHRFKVEFPIVFSGDRAGTGTVYNLGLGGCKIISGSVVSAGDILNIQLSLPMIIPPVRVHAATVRWTVESEFGVDFLGLQESERDRLVQFIDTLSQAA